MQFSVMSREGLTRKKTWGKAKLVQELMMENSSSQGPVGGVGWMREDCRTWGQRELLDSSEQGGDPIWHCHSITLAIVLNRSKDIKNGSKTIVISKRDAGPMRSPQPLLMNWTWTVSGGGLLGQQLGFWWQQWEESSWHCLRLGRTVTDVFNLRCRINNWIYIYISWGRINIYF